MIKIQAVSFPSAGSHPEQIEGLFYHSEDEVRRSAAVVCHPHPLGGGSMHNNVVVAIAKALGEQGIVTLRFNFRGVGRSSGLHDNGRGERADVAGAVDWLSAQPAVDPRRLFLVGYSFGAWVGLSHAVDDMRLAAVAAVGLVAWHYDAEFFKSDARPDLGVEPWQLEPDFLESFDRPKLFVGAEHDGWAPPDALRRLVDRLPPPKELAVLAGTDHFFRGRERQVGEKVARFLAGL